MAEWARTASTTIREFGESYEETLLRDQAITALMVEDGRIKFNCAGDGFDWAVAYARANVVGNRGDQPVDFDAVDRFVRPFLDYRGYITSDSMNKLEFLKNRSKPALIKYFSEMGENLYDDMGRYFQQQWWVNGNASGNQDCIHGVESFLQQAGNSVNSTTGAIRSYQAADYVAAPSATYANLNTDLGAYGGSVTGVWPNSFVAGNDGDTFDFFSPILVNYNSSAFTGSTWATNSTDALRFLISAAQKDSSSRGLLDVILLNTDLYRQFKTKNDPLQRINVENTQLRKLGFKDTIVLDGCEIKAEFGIGPGIGYGFNTKQMLLRSMQGKMFVSDGPTWHQQSRSWRVAVDFMGNLQCYSPKYFGKLQAYNGTAGL